MDDDKKEGGSSGSGPINIEGYLEDMDYPATKQDIIDRANENDAPDEVMDKLDRITDKEYVTPAEVSKELARAK